MILTPRGETMAAGEVPWFAVINLGNSIIGVSILAMPWCFRECGVVLATVLIIFGGFMTKISCNLLLRASKATRRQSYAFLAYHTLGATGKLAVEMSIIGLLVCTCIAFFVIMGDLGPAIVSKWGGFENNWELRVCLLVFMAVAIVMPLGLRRSIESLSNISTMSILFYMLFSSDIILNSLPTLTSGTWVKDLVLWRSAGTLKGVSIFALAFSCQTVLFVVYDSLPEKTPKQMESVVNRAVSLVGSVYIVVGFFGYITYNSSGIKGDILLNFAPGLVSEVLRLGFTLSVALSFPLVIFPCRASIYTLFFSQSHSLENPHGGGSEYIPPSMFKLITLILVVFTLVLGITIPNVEVILGLTGATLGCLICFIFPALIYLRTTGVPNKNTGKVVLAIGILILICSTYDNLQSMQKEADVEIPRLDVEEEVRRLEQAANKLAIDKADVPGDVNEGVLHKDIGDIGKEPILMIDKEEKSVEKDKGEDVKKTEEDKEGDQLKEQPKGADDTNPEEAQVINEKRQEPPIPHAPVDQEERVKPPEDAVERDKEDIKEALVIERDEEKEQEGKKEEDQEGKREGEDNAKEDADDKEKEGKDQDEEKAEKEESPKDDDEKASLEKIVEVKVIEQEHKQEEQDKQLKEIKEKQELQEKIIKEQAEELGRLRVQHEEELKQKEKEKVQKIVEEREKELKEKEEAERKAKQDELLIRQQELQNQQHQLQQQQIQQQQQQQQPLAGAGLVDGGVIPQQVGGVPQQAGLGLPVGGDGLGIPQDTGLQPGGFGAGGLGQQQPGFVEGMAGLGDGLGIPQQQQQQPGLVDGMAGGLQPGVMQQPGDLIDGGVLQQQQQQQQQILAGQQQQQIGLQQQMGQPLVPQQAALPVGGAGGQVPLQDGAGINMQQGGQGMLNQQVAAMQDKIPADPVVQGMDQLAQGQQPLDRVARNVQDPGQLGGIKQQPMGVPQQGIGMAGNGQMQGIQQQGGIQQNLVQQQQLINQQNLQQQPMVPVQQNFQNQGLQQQQILQQPVIQQQQQVAINQQPLDKVPALVQNNFEQNIKPVRVGADSNAANRQLKLVNTPIPKTVSKDYKTLHVSKGQQSDKNIEGNVNNEEKYKNELHMSDEDKMNHNQKVGGHESDAMVRQGATSLQEDQEKNLDTVPGKGKEEEEDTNVHQKVLVEEEEDADMELAKSLEQQLNNQFKQVGAMAQGRMIKSQDEVKKSRKEEV